MAQQSTSGIDLRARFAVVLIVSFCVFFLQQEALPAITAALTAIYLCLFKRYKNAIGLVVGYAVLFLLGRWMLQLPSIGGFTVLMQIMRKLMLPVMAAIPVSKAPTGVLVATLRRMRVPQMLVISIAVLFRFMPTVFTEFRAIRDAQKFRGIGVSVWGLAAHPLKSAEYILVPMLIRTAKVSDELSASALTRGADTSGVNSTYRMVRFGSRDGVLVGAALLLGGGLFAFEYLLQGVLI